jgi:hypothetical protein
MERFVCHRCGEVHDELPAFGPELPQRVAEIPESEREGRVVLNGEMCVLDDDQQWIRACLDLPLSDDDGHFRWLAWVSLSAVDFDDAIERWMDPERVGRRPYSGRLGSEIPTHPASEGLRCRVVAQPVGDRPQLELEGDQDHALVAAQRHGVPRDVAIAWAEGLMHDG